MLNDKALEKVLKRETLNPECSLAERRSGKFIEKLDCQISKKLVSYRSSIPTKLYEEDQRQLIETLSKPNIPTSICHRY
jgi:hypothetical protein